MHREKIGAPSPIGQVFEAVLGGRAPSPNAVADAVFQFAEGMFGIKLSPEERARAAAAGGAAWDEARARSSSRSSSPGSEPPPSGASSAPGGPTKQEIRDARAMLGFSASEPLTPEIVKQRYRELAKKWHPDRFMSDARKHKVATIRMGEINAAMEILSKSV